MVILTGILTNPDRDKHVAAIRGTYLNRLPTPLFIRPKNDGSVENTDDHILLTKSDIPSQDPRTILELYEHLLVHHRFDYFLKIDDSCFIHSHLLDMTVVELQNTPKEKSHYMGQIVSPPQESSSTVTELFSAPPFCDRHAGVFLSRVAMELIVKTGRQYFLSTSTDQDEDQLHGIVLAKAGIHPHPLPTFFCTPHLRPSEILQQDQQAKHKIGDDTCVQVALHHSPVSGLINLTTRKSITTPITLPDKVASSVYVHNTLEYLTQAEGIDLLRECLRILSEDGTLRIKSQTTPLVNSMRHGLNSSPNHQSLWNREDLIRNLALLNIAMTPVEQGQSTRSDLRDLELNVYPQDQVDSFYLESITPYTGIPPHSSAQQFILLCGDNRKQIGHLIQVLNRLPDIHLSLETWESIQNLLTRYIETLSATKANTTSSDISSHEHYQKTLRKQISELIATFARNGHQKSITGCCSLLVPDDIDDLTTSIAALGELFGNTLRVVFVTNDQSSSALTRFSTVLQESYQSQGIRYYQYDSGSLTLEGLQTLLSDLGIEHDKDRIQTTDFLPDDQTKIQVPNPRHGALGVSIWSKPASIPFDHGRIAFLFLCRDNLNHSRIWQEYLRGNEENYSLYCHAKFPHLVNDKFLQDAIIPPYHETEWGDISLVRATLSLLKQALQNPENRAFILCSESCLPIKPFRSLQKFIGVHPKGALSLETLKSVSDKDWQKAARADLAPLVPPNHWCFHPQWFLMGRAMAEAVVEDDRTFCFEDTFASDESYFGTMLRMKKFPMETSPPIKQITFNEWNSALSTDHPVAFEKIDKALLDKLVRSHSFFARKFSTKCDMTRFHLHLEQSNTNH